MLLAALLLAPLWPSAARAQGAAVQVRFSTESIADGLFPSDVFSVRDTAQNTGLRVNLPKPNCRGSDTARCASLDVINALDGFNLQPRLTIPLSGAIDQASIRSENVFLLRLGPPAPGAGAARIGIDQEVVDTRTHTVFAESDELLDQQSRYALVVTRGVRDSAGMPLAPLALDALLAQLQKGRPDRPDLLAELMQALAEVSASGVPRDQIAGLSVFTTQSATAELEKIRDRIQSLTPAPADFLLGAARERTVFSLADVQDVTFRRQISLRPQFVDTPLSLEPLRRVAGSVERIAFGKFSSPNFETADRVIPALGTRTGVPAEQSRVDVFFNLFLPGGTPPRAGWPVAIFGHALGGTKNDAIDLASALGARGIATIAINAVGHGGGPASLLGVRLLSQPGAGLKLSAGGLGVDVNKDMAIGPAEGSSATGIVGARDGLRQTAIHLMQLVREIRVGMDVDGNGTRDLDPGRIFYVGQQFGGIYGLDLLAVEPEVRAGVLNVTGGPLAEIGRLSTPMGQALAPLRKAEALVTRNNTMIDAQENLDLSEWAAQSGDAVAYAPHIRRQPLAGVPAKSIIFQFAKGDQTVPNPTSSAVVRAGDFADRTTFLRNDTVVATVPMAPVNAHLFLQRASDPIAAIAQLAVQAQDQIAVFFASNGAMFVDPDGAGNLFEAPIAGGRAGLPEQLNTIMAPPPMMMMPGAMAPGAARAPGTPAAPAAPAPMAPGAPAPAPAAPPAPAPAPVPAPAAR